MNIRNERDANNAIAQTCEERTGRQQAWADPSKRVHDSIPVGWLLLLSLTVFWGCVALWIMFG